MRRECSREVSADKLARAEHEVGGVIGVLWYT
jgi:hypothetical protein